MDLSITADGFTSQGDGKDGKGKLKPSGTFTQTMTVTNNSDETATGVVVGTELQAGFDVWESGQTTTEYGTDWNVTGMTDTTNGTVTVNDIPLAGMDMKEIDLENHAKGDLTWELGTPLAPGETATMTFHSQLAADKAAGTTAQHNVSILHVDQPDINPSNDTVVVQYDFGTPIALDLGGDGIQTLRVDEGVEFDILNTGDKVQTGWISGEDALLAVDHNNNGQIDDRSELFGGEVGEGFSTLATFDSNDDGLVDKNDADFGELEVWQDKDENGLTDDGELFSLESAGVASMNTAYTDVFSFDDQGNIHGEHSSATLADGSTVDMVDIYFEIDA